MAGGTLRERVSVASSASRVVEAPLVIRLGGDGADIGPVKAGVATGELLEAHPGHGDGASRARTSAGVRPLTGRPTRSRFA